MKKQILLIHGGDNFATYEEYIDFLKKYEVKLEELDAKRWKENLSEKLGGDFEVIFPKMPNPMNAKYAEWKITFEKFFPFLKDNIILVGHSLGGIFLAKYLSENKFPQKILATFLVSAPYDEKDTNEFLGDFNLPESLEMFREQGGKIFLYHSKDDEVVPFIDFEKYKKVLPEAETMVFEDRGHFDQNEFLELVKDIKSLN